MRARARANYDMMLNNYSAKSTHNVWCLRGGALVSRLAGACSEFPVPQWQTTEIDRYVQRFSD